MNRSRFLLSYMATAVLVLLATSFIALPAQALGTIYVNHAATGNNDGTDWANAYTDLQDALAEAGNGDEIWVARGVYTPGTAATDSFQLINGVALYGGFAATETVRTERDWRTHITVLSGDIGGDDVTDVNGVLLNPANIVGTNSQHVVTADAISSNTILDGFTITGGDAASDGFCPEACGGGILNTNASSYRLENLAIRGNRAQFGGGLHNSLNSNVTVYNVLVQGNSAVRNGGGVLNSQSSTAAFVNVVISGNTAAQSGGGFYNSGSNPLLTNVTMSGNWAGVAGGGMANRGNGRATLTNAIVWHNGDQSGVGTLTANLDNNVGSLPDVRYSLVQGSGGSGGWLSNAGRDLGNNIDANPLFVAPIDPDDAPTAAGNFDLQIISLVVDVGLNGANLLAHDIAGNDRIQNGRIDMGAYETPPAAVVRIMWVGTGVGRVTSSPAGVDCTGSCAVAYELGDTVSLTAVSTSPESTFVGWSGPCSGTAACVLELDMSRTVTATFNMNQYPLTIAKTGGGSGVVESSPLGIFCGGSCTANFDFGQTVTLTAVASNKSVFRGWSGACSGQATQCEVAINGAKSATARFDPPPIYLPLISTP
jgi:hypothetical protein